MANIVITDKTNGVEIVFNDMSTHHKCRVKNYPKNVAMVSSDRNNKFVRIEYGNNSIDLEYIKIDTPTSTDIDDLIIQLRAFFFKLKARSIMFMNNDWLASGTATPALIYDPEEGRIVNRFTSGDAPKSGIWRIRFALPEDFDSFPVNAVQLDTRRSADVTGMSLLLEGDGGTHDPDINGADVEPTANGVFQTKKLTPTGDYKAGDVITFSQENNLQASRTVLLDRFKVVYNSK